MRLQGLLVCFILLAGASPPVTGQGLDTTFTYQGVLSDADGIIDEFYDFRVRLFDGPAGAGSEVSTANVFDDVTVRKGVFVLDLDFGSEVFAGTERWLQFEVKRVDETVYQALSPRQRINPVPASMVADLVDWSSIQNVPAGLADGTDDDSLSDLACSDGQTLTYVASASSWNCSDLVPGPEGPAGTPGEGLDLLQGFTCPSLGTSCDDGNNCTVNDTAIGGVYGFDASGNPLCGTLGIGCRGVPVDCNDGNQCTADFCDPSTGCVNVILDGVSCDDGDPNTVLDICNAGICIGS